MVYGINYVTWYRVKLATPWNFSNIFQHFSFIFQSFGLFCIIQLIVLLGQNTNYDVERPPSTSSTPPERPKELMPLAKKKPLTPIPIPIPKVPSPASDKKYKAAHRRSTDNGNQWTIKCINVSDAAHCFPHHRHLSSNINDHSYHAWQMGDNWCFLSFVPQLSIPIVWFFTYRLAACLVVSSLSQRMSITSAHIHRRKRLLLTTRLNAFLSGSYMSPCRYHLLQQKITLCCNL